MGDNISNQTNLSFQLSDGVGLFTGTDLINVSVLTGILSATQFIGDGGLLSNIQGGGGGNILTGVPGEVAYYTNVHDISGLSNITVDSTTGLINIHSNSHATNVTVLSVIFDVSSNVDVGNIDYYPTLQAVCDTGNTYTGDIQINNLIVQNHILTNSFTFTSLAASNVIFYNSTGTDTIGYITFSPDASLIPPSLSLSFNSSYSNEPVVIINAVNSAAANLISISRMFSSTTTFGFNLNFVNAATSTDICIFSYMIMGSF